MYLGYQRINVTAAVKTVSVLTIPMGTTHVEIVAEVGSVRYTMDNVTVPSAALPSGMVFKITDPPKSFLVEDLMRIQFCSDIQADALANEALNFHYFGGRSI